VNQKCSRGCQSIASARSRLKEVRGMLFY
jgi:hypothetical protein